jgi:hypothetical protein
MKLPEELTNGQAFKSEILIPLLIVILFHFHWIALACCIAYVILRIAA